MLKKLLKEVAIIVVGKQSAEIMDFLDTKKYENEFLLAKKLGITINQIRNILYRLSDHGLVSSIRKKDKRKGWYTYFWKIETLKSLEFLRNIQIKKIDQISHQVRKRKTKTFYVCERCNIEFNEENALLYDFTCNECGGLFSMKDNTKVLKEFNRNLDKLKKKLKIVDEEIKKEKDLIESNKLRELKKEEKQKAKKAVARKKKKPVKKKVTKKVLKKKAVKKKVAKKKYIKKKKLAKKKKPKKMTRKKVKVKKKSTKKKVVKKKKLKPKKKSKKK